MKIGDLVTLSSRCLQRNDMAHWRKRIWNDKESLVGLIIDIKKPNYYDQISDISENMKTRFYVRWIQKNGPDGRWGHSFHFDDDCYFLRNDLVYVK